MSMPWMTDDRPEWIREVAAWIESQDVGTILETSVVHERIWGAVLRVATDERVVHFKALGLGCSHETAVLGYLGAAWPALAPTIYAIDDARGWLIVGDDGSAMYDAADAERQVAAMEQTLGDYARMQLASASATQDLIDAGIPDRRMSVVPAMVEGILDTSLTFGRALPLTSQQRRRIGSLLPELRDVCTELTERRATLDHGDLHSKNILVRGELARIIDWGDACVTHPFCSLLPIYLLSVPWMKNIDKSAAARRITIAYLEPFGAAQDGELAASMWVGLVTRALHSVHMLDGMPEPFFTEWLGYVADLFSLWADRYDAMRDGAIVDVLVNA